MEMMLKVDTAVVVPVNIFPLLDDTDFKTREAVAYNAAGMDLKWNFVTKAGATTSTAVTPTTAGNYDWTDLGDGMMKIEIPASGGASINNDTEGFGWFTGYATGVLPWRGPIICFAIAATVDALLDGTANLPADAKAISGDATAADNLELAYDGTGYAGGTTKPNVNVASIDNIDLTPTMKASVNAEVDTALNTAIPGSPATDSVNARLDAAISTRLAPAGTLATVTTLTNHPDSAGTTTLLERILGTLAAGTHNPQTGDAYAATQTILARLGAWAGTGLNTILGAFRALMAKAAALTPTDISTGTTFDNTTDSVEGIRDTAPLGTAMRGTDGAVTSLAGVAATGEAAAASSQGEAAAAVVGLALAGEAEAAFASRTTGGAGTEFLAPLLALGPGGGTGLTAQETRDAMKLAPSAGAPAADSIDAQIAAIPTADAASPATAAQVAAEAVADLLATMAPGGVLTSEAFAGTGLAIESGPGELESLIYVATGAASRLINGLFYALANWDLSAPGMTMAVAYTGVIQPGCKLELLAKNYGSGIESAYGYLDDTGAWTQTGTPAFSQANMLKIMGTAEGHATAFTAGALSITVEGGEPGFFYEAMPLVWTLPATVGGGSYFAMRDGTVSMQRAASSIATVQAAVSAAKAVTDKLDTALELNAGAYRLTTAALANAPAGGGGAGIGGVGFSTEQE